MIYSMFAMILLTFSVAAYLLKLRIDAVRKGEIKLSVLRLLNSPDIPLKIQQVSRNYSNLFEMPILFYCAAILGLALHLNTPLMIALSWFFVASRAVHSWIHVTSNNVIRRLQAFMVGNICMLLMWIMLVWHYSTSHLIN
jgi:hypothetical protein